MRASASKEASDAEMLKFHNLVKSNHPAALEARDNFKKTSDKGQFNLDIIRIVRSEGQRGEAVVPSGPPALPIPTADGMSKSAPRQPEHRVGETRNGLPNDICYKFIEGKCSRGSSCKFSHDLSGGTKRNSENFQSVSHNPVMGRPSRGTTASEKRDAKPDKGSLGRSSTSKKAAESKPHSAAKVVEDIAVTTVVAESTSEQVLPASESVLQVEDSSNANGAQSQGNGDADHLLGADASSTLRLRDLLSSSSNISPLLGGFGMAPRLSSSTLDKLSLSESASENGSSIYRGSKLTDTLELDNLLYGVPGFYEQDQKQTASTAPFSYETSFSYPNILDGDRRRDSMQHSSLFHHSNAASNSSSITGESDARQMPTAARSHPPGFHPDEQENDFSAAGAGGESSGVQFPMVDHPRSSQQQEGPDQLYDHNSSDPREQTFFRDANKANYPAMVPVYVEQGSYPPPPFMDPRMMPPMPYGSMMPMQAPRMDQGHPMDHHVGGPPFFDSRYGVMPFFPPPGLFMDPMNPQMQPPFIPGMAPPFLYPGPPGAFFMMGHPPLSPYNMMPTGPSNANENHLQNGQLGDTPSALITAASGTDASEEKATAVKRPASLESSMIAAEDRQQRTSEPPSSAAAAKPEKKQSGKDKVDKPKQKLTTPQENGVAVQCDVEVTTDPSSIKNSSPPPINSTKTELLKSLLRKDSKPVIAVDPVPLVTDPSQRVSEPMQVGAPNQKPTAAPLDSENVTAEGVEDHIVKKTHVAFRTYRPSELSRMSIFTKSDHLQNADFGRGNAQRGGGRLVIVPPDGSLNCNQSFSVQWQVPLAVVNAVKAGNGSLAIGLHRMGSLTNGTSIVTKKLLESKNMSVVTFEGVQLQRGEIFFFAPKAAGLYVLRIFDNSTKDRMATTLCISSAFSVELTGRDVVTNLKYSYDLLKSQDNEIMGVVSLRTGVEGMKSPGVPADGDNPVDLLNKAMELIFSAITRTINHNDIGTVVENRLDHEESLDEKAELDELVKDKKLRAMVDKLHGESFETMKIIRLSEVAMSMLLPDKTRKLITFLDFYCPILGRFHETEQDLVANRIEKLGFYPSLYFGYRTPEHNRFVPHLVDAVSSAMLQKLQDLIPPREFYVQREETRRRIESLLLRSGVIQTQSSISLALFGSSRNGFGSVGADLDMCIMGNPSSLKCSDNEESCGAAVIEKIAAVLAANGMRNVEARSTARIPIVLFEDPTSGIDCDISLSNPLALRNTELLQLYSSIDPRVRQLAFVIKHWAKQRQINSPQDGTLGSYAYILCLIQFLQTRQPPLLPNLQQLPPNWRAFDGVDHYRGSTLPRRMESHPVEKNVVCDTYFYSAPVVSSEAAAFDVMQELQLFASRNRQSCGELLVDFFGFFAWGFDYKHDVISVRAGRPIRKIEKSEYSCWPQNDRLSIEDPFETWYDVGHVLKGPQMEFMRREFVRAHSILTRFCQYPANVLLSRPLDSSDNLDDEFRLAVGMEPAKCGSGADKGINFSLFDPIKILCTKGAQPPFIKAVKHGTASDHPVTA